MSKKERALVEENERLRTLCAQVSAERDDLVAKYDPGPSPPTWHDLQPRDVVTGVIPPFCGAFGSTETACLVEAIVDLCKEHHPNHWGVWSAKFIAPLYHRTGYGDEDVDVSLELSIYAGDQLELTESNRFGLVYGLSDKARKALFALPENLANLTARRCKNYREGRS